MNSEVDAAVPAGQPLWWTRIPWWVGFLVLFLALPTRVYHGDGLAMVQRLTATYWWEDFDPNHFIWGLVVRGALGLGHVVGVPRALPVEMFWLQALTGVVGVLTLVEFRRWCQIFRLTPTTERWLLGAFGLSFTFWHYSTDVDMYIPTLLVSLLGLRALWDYVDSGAASRLFHAILWLSFAVLLHQLAIFAALVGLWWLGRHPAPGRWTPRQAQMRLLAGGILLVGVPYLLVAEWVYRDTVMGGIGNYVFGDYATGTSADWGPREFARRPWLWPAAVLIGHWNLVGYADHALTHYSFVHPLWDGWFAQKWPWLPVLGWGWVSWWGWKGFRTLPATDPVQARGLDLLRGWIVVMFIFHLLLKPGFAYYRLTYLAPMWLAWGLLVDRGLVPKRLARGILIGLLCWNVGAGILPNSVIGNAPLYRQTLSWAKVLTPRDLVITNRKPYPTLIQYMRVFAGVQRIVTANSWIVIPPTPADRPAYAALDAATLPQLFEHIYLDNMLAEEFETTGELRFAVRTFPSYGEKEIVLTQADWTLGDWLPASNLSINFRELVPRTPPD